MESGQKRTRNGNDMRDTKSEIRTARINIYETQKRYQETEIIYYGLWVKPTPLRQPLLVASPFFHLALNAGHPSWSKVTNHTVRSINKTARAADQQRDMRFWLFATL